MLQICYVHPLGGTHLRTCLQRLDAFLYYSTFYLLRQGLSLSLASQWAPRNPTCLLPPVSASQVKLLYLVCNVGPGNPNSRLHACMAATLLTEPAADLLFVVDLDRLFETVSLYSFGCSRAHYTRLALNSEFACPCLLSVKLKACGTVPSMCFLSERTCEESSASSKNQITRKTATN